MRERGGKSYSFYYGKAMHPSPYHTHNKYNLSNTKLADYSLDTTVNIAHRYADSCKSKKHWLCHGLAEYIVSCFQIQLTSSGVQKVKAEGCFQLRSPILKEK